MFARPNAHHHQVAYVTNDIEGAARLLETEYDAPGFFIFSNVQPGLKTKDAPQLKIGLTRVGGVEIELIEPIGSTAPIFSDFLPEGQGLVIRFHHVAIRIRGPMQNWVDHLASIDRTSHPVVFEGAMGDSLRFLYTDERQRVGHYVEHVWMSQELLAQVCGNTPTYPEPSA